MFIEWARKPRLYLHIAPPSDQEYGDGVHPARVMRCLRIRVQNEELPKLLRWMRRESATSCLGTIRFLYYPDGKSLFTEDMPARWAGSPEATPLRGSIGRGVPIEIWDTSRLTIISKMDIPPGEQEDLDLAVRCDDDTEAYGWNNESYWSGWKNKKWTLAKGRYMIAVRSAGQKVVGRFLLNNDHGRDQFRIEPV